MAPRDGRKGPRQGQRLSPFFPVTNPITHIPHTYPNIPKDICSFQGAAHPPAHRDRRLPGRFVRAAYEKEPISMPETALFLQGCFFYTTIIPQVQYKCK